MIIRWYVTSFFHCQGNAISSDGVVIIFGAFALSAVLFDILALVGKTN